MYSVEGQIQYDIEQTLHVHGNILIVDDTQENIEILGKTLEAKGHEISVALNGVDGIEIANHTLPDLILLDIMMPGMDGYEVCRLLKENPKTRNIPIIFISALDDVGQVCQAFSLGGVDYIVKPFRREEVLSRVNTHLQLRKLMKEREDEQARLELAVTLRTQELNETRLEVINRLSRAGEYRDNETGMHVIRMSHYSAELAKAAGMSSKESELLLHASPMHDVGKIGIPDRILLKPGKLDAEEWNIMKTHVDIGVEILSGNHSDLMVMARTVAQEHHEKWDGTGYPLGKRGEEISLVGRVVALCDVFDALTSERPYKKAWSIEKALDFIEDQKGKHFDPSLVDLFKEIFPQLLLLKEEFAD